MPYSDGERSALAHNSNILKWINVEPLEIWKWRSLAQYWRSEPLRFIITRWNFLLRPHSFIGHPSIMQSRWLDLDRLEWQLMQQWRWYIAIVYNQFPNVLETLNNCLKTCYYVERLARELTSWYGLFLQSLCSNITISTQSGCADGVIADAARKQYGSRQCMLNIFMLPATCYLLLKADALACWIRLLCTFEVRI